MCVATCASAQQAPETDTRTQYPAFLANSYFSFNVGSIGYLFSADQLQPGFQVQSVDVPRLAARVDLFGHHFNKYVSAQVTYLRPARFVAYNNINEDGKTGQVSMAYGGFTLVGHIPLDRVNDRVSAYVEGGVGITSRSGIEQNGTTVVQSAHYTAAMVGGGFAYRWKPDMDLLLGFTYSPGRKSFSQPSTRLYTLGFRYQMQPLAPAKVEENRRSEFTFPANVARIGYTTNQLTYGVNNFFSRTVPVFWGGNVEARRGFTITYERNVFHTKERFAFDLGASAGVWKSNINKDVFTTLSAYPMFKFFILRIDPADVYFTYSLAGPSYISETVIDGSDTGANFTFQDFMGIGMYFGKDRRYIGELSIRHYSNGNLFTRNASIKIPLTLSLGLTF